MNTPENYSTFEYLGCRNGWSGHYEDGNGNEVPKAQAKVWRDHEPEALKKCRDQGHQIEGYSTMRGYHESWCTICKIKWDMDSGD